MTMAEDGVPIPLEEALALQCPCCAQRVPMSQVRVLQLGLELSDDRPAVRMCASCFTLADLIGQAILEVSQAQQAGNLGAHLAINAVTRMRRAGVVVVPYGGVAMPTWMMQGLLRATGMKDADELVAWVRTYGLEGEGG